MGAAQEIASRIRQAIGDEPVSSFARRAGIGDTLMRKYLAGSMPSAKNLVAIARAAGVSVEWLATGSQQPGNEEYATIPVLDVRASAGGGAVPQGERPIDWLAFRRDWLRRTLHARPEDLHVITIEGDSMEPSLSDGDVVLVDPRVTGPLREGIYVLRFGDTVIAKRVQPLGRGRVRLISDNPAYPPMDVRLGPEGEAEIIGRVVWVGRTVG